jgi:hypothetical protein
MAKTYYKPQPVAAQTQINWAEVGKNFSDMLSEDKRVKDEKRAALDEMSREAVNVVNNVEDGQSATANQWWLAAGGQVQDAMLMSKGLLKSGQITANQFVQMQQNVNDGTDGLIGVFEKFNKDYVLKQERAGCKDPTGVGCSQKLESWAMEQLESMGNFQNTAVVVNPETLMLSVVDLVDGKIVDDPNKVRSINSLQTMAGSEFNKFDLDTATKTFVDKTGTWQQVSNSVSSATRKGIKTITSSPFFKDFTKADIEALKKTGATEEQIKSIQGQGNVYFAAEQQLVQTIMADDLQSTSILTNSIGSDDEGNDYTFSFNKERGANEILMKQEGGFLVPDFTDEKGKAQLKKVEEFIKTDVRNQTNTETTSSIQDDRRVKSSSGSGPTQAQTKARINKENHGEIAKYTYRYVTSDKVEDLDEIEAILKSFNPNLQSIKKVGGNYIVKKRSTTREGEISTDSIPISGSPQEMVKTLLGYFSPSQVDNPTEIVSNAVDFSGNSELNNTAFQAADEELENEPIGVSIDREVNGLDLGDFYIEGDEGFSSNKINEFINTLGYSDLLLGLKAETGGRNTVVLKDEGGNSLYTFYLAESKESVGINGITKNIKKVVAAQLKKNTAKRSEIGSFLDVQQVGAAPSSTGGGVDYSTK